MAVQPTRSSRLFVSILVGLGLTSLGLAVPAEGTAQSPESEVRELFEHPTVRSAFDEIMELEPRTMEDLVTLTEIPAPPFMEEERARVYAQWLEEAGADSVWIDEEGNAIGLRRGRVGDRTIALGGHLDTVFPEGTDVTVRQSGDTLFAPGIGDDTRGLIVVLTVLRAMEAAGVETDDDLWFVGVVGEEGLGDLRGMKYLFREGAHPIDAWIEVDGGGLDRIVNKGLGSHRYRVTFQGPGGHSWGAFGLANPAHALGRAIRHFQDTADVLTRSGPRTSYNIGQIGGGTSVNSIPFEAWALIDMRSVSPESLNRIDAALQASVQRALEEENTLRRDGDALTVDVDMIGNRPSAEHPDDLPLVVRAATATTLLGGTPTLARSSTDSNIPIAAGVPAVTIGRGGEGANGHAPDEWWINRDGHLSIQQALLVLVAEAGLAGPVS